MKTDKIQQNQTIAIEKGIKNRTKSTQTEIYKALQKSTLFNGQVRSFEKIKDDTPDIPEEKIQVQMNARDAIKNVSKVLVEYFDISATKDWGNCESKADVIIDGEVVLEQVPVTYLLFLEKELNDIHTFVGAIPTLDPAHQWSKDENGHLYYAEPTRTQRTQKVQRPIVLYDATPEHPAQTQIITEDETVGYWVTKNMSGALPAPEKEDMLERVEKLLKAVKSAREKGNTTEVDKQEIGQKILKLIFG